MRREEDRRDEMGEEGRDEKIGERRQGGRKGQDRRGEGEENNVRKIFSAFIIYIPLSLHCLS